LFLSAIFWILPKDAWGHSPKPVTANTPAELTNNVNLKCDFMVAF